MEDLHIYFVFTERAKAAYPKLATLRCRLDASRAPPVAPWVMPGDIVSLEGVPVSDGLEVIGRRWTLMSDETSLAFILDLVE